MTFKPNNNGPLGPSNPDDTKNLIIFFVLSAIIFVALDSFILRPARLAQEKAQAEQQAMLAEEEAKADPVVIARDLDDVLAEAPRIKIDNGALMGSLSLKGNRIDDLALSNYYETLEKKKHVHLFTPAGTDHPQYAEFGWLASDAAINTPNKNTTWKREPSPEKGILSFSWDNGQGLIFERDITLDDKFMFHVEQRVRNNSTQDITLFPYALVARQGLPEGLQGRMVLHEGPIGYFGGSLSEYDYDDLVKEKEVSETSTSGWIGLTEKYWFAGLVPDQKEPHKFRYAYKERLNNPEKGIYRTDLTGEPRVIKAGEQAVHNMNLFVGAKQIDILEDYETKLHMPHFDLVIDFGWLYFMTRPLHFVLRFFYHLTGNFGVAIILLTVLVRGSVYPLANTSFKSFAKMKQISPQMTELREKYGEDKAKLQQEIIKLYEREKVNPMAGCFPILIQIPIFFAMYKVIYVAIEMRHAPFFGWIQDLSAQDPTSFVNLFGLLPFEAPQALHIGAWSCLMLVFLLIQKKMNPPPQDPIQKHMMTFFPFFITFILSKFPSGLVIYWTCSNFLSITQQYIIMTRMGVPVYLFNKSKYEALLEKQVEKGPAIHPEMEMISEEVEDALFGDDDEQQVSKSVSAPKPKKKKKKK